MGADAGAPTCASCTLSDSSNRPQCPVSIPIGAATWSLAYDPVKTDVYVTEVVSSCPANGGWTPACRSGSPTDAGADASDGSSMASGQDCTSCYHNNATNAGCPSGYTANQCPCSCFASGSSDSTTSCGPTSRLCVDGTTNAGQSCIVTAPADGG